MLTNHPINSRVFVRITRSIPPGLLGHLVDGPAGPQADGQRAPGPQASGTKAIVRNREIAWDEPRPVETYVDQTFEALVIGYNPAYEELELSLRLAERDPWRQIEERYPVGAEVDGQVIGLAEKAAFVELEPGVEGFLPISELAPFHVEQIEDWLWIDDEVKAIVTRIDPPRRRLGLSIRERLQERDARTRREMWASNRDIPSGTITLAELIPTETRLQLLRLDEEMPVAPEPRLNVLIVEDDETYAAGLGSLLRRRGCEVTWTPDGAGGLSAARATEAPYDLILLDWNLPGIKGDQLARMLRQECDTSRLAMVLEPAPLDEQPGVLDSLREMGVDIFSKAHGEHLREGLLVILQEIRSDGSARRPLRSLDPSDPRDRRAGGFEPLPPQEGAPGLGPGASTASQGESMRAILERLQGNTRATVVAVLRLDAGQRRFAIEAAVGRPFPVAEAGVDLIYSPLGDVVEKDELVCEKVIPPSKKYARLLDLLSFEGFLGVPLLPVGASRYGLILLKKRGGFGRAARQEAQSAAYLIGAILSQRRLSQSLLVWQAQSLVGRLVSSVIHEVNNKLGAIQFLIEDVQGGLRELGRWPEKAKDVTFMRNLEGAAEAIARAQGEAHGLRDQYLNLTAIDDPQYIDLAALASSIVHVLRVEAQKHNVQIEVRPAPDLPPVLARPSRVRQILMNLILNAIQHIAGLRPYGRLSVELEHDPRAPLPLQVRFADDGPGIHRQLWDRVFEFGFTTKKEGAGLGLTISRQAAESLGGRLIVESSYVLWGTTFLLELPGGSLE